jgi:hypothetical protein
LVVGWWLVLVVWGVHGWGALGPRRGRRVGHGGQCRTPTRSPSWRPNWPRWVEGWARTCVAGYLETLVRSVHRRILGLCRGIGRDPLLGGGKGVLGGGGLAPEPGPPPTSTSQSATRRLASAHAARNEPEPETGRRARDREKWKAFIESTTNEPREPICWWLGATACLGPASMCQPVGLCNPVQSSQPPRPTARPQRAHTVTSASR